MVHLLQRVALHLSQMRGVDVKASQSTHNAVTRGSVDWSCIGVGRCVVGGSGEVGESSAVSAVVVVSALRGIAFRWGGSIVVVSGAGASAWTIPVRPGRDMARLVEVAASVQALRGMGHDSAKEFSDRLIQFMAKGKSGQAGEA